MRLLVTGCCGFIGSNFVHYILSKHRDWVIVGLDKLTYAGNLENLADLGEEERKRFTFLRGDICERETVTRAFLEFAPDAVVHFAAESHVDRSIEDPDTFIRTNVLGTQVLLDVARRVWGKDTAHKKFLYISTDEVYGEILEGKAKESDPLCPRSPYAASKASGDLLAQAYSVTYGLPVVVTRCTNNYGPYQFPEKLIPFMVYNALNYRELPVYGDGKQKREWIYVLDHCRALEVVLLQGKPGETYNIGSGEEKENLEVVRMILKILQEKTKDPKIHEGLIRHVTDRPGHDRRYALDTGKIERELGFHPEITFQEGLEKTISWYLEHWEWVEHVVSGKYLEFYKKWEQAGG